MTVRARLSVATGAAVLAAALISAASIMTSTAHDYDAGKLNITHPWARPTLGNVMIGAVYVVISNDGDTAETLLAARTEVAERTEIHETVTVGDIAKMQPVKGGVEIAADDAVLFEPLGKHIMLLGLKKKLAAGETFSLTLVFKNQGEVNIDVRIEKPSKIKAGEGNGSHGSHDGQ